MVKKYLEKHLYHFQKESLSQLIIIFNQKSAYFLTQIYWKFIAYKHKNSQRCISWYKSNAYHYT